MAAHKFSIVVRVCFIVVYARTYYFIVILLYCLLFFVNVFSVNNKKQIITSVSSGTL